MTFTTALNTLCTSLIVIIPFFSKVTPNLDVLYNLLLTVCAIYGASIAMLQVTLYGVAGPVPELTVAFMVGLGLSSFLTNLLRIALHVLINDPDVEAVIFFGICTLFMSVCTYLSYLFLS